MKSLEPKTFSDYLIMFLHKDSWTLLTLSVRVDIPARTLSDRIKFNNWHLDEKRVIKKLMKERGYNFDV